MTGKEIKKAARGALKRHYAPFVALCLIAALLGGAPALWATVYQSLHTGQAPTAQTAVLPLEVSAARTLAELAQEPDGATARLQAREAELAGQGSGALGRSAGVLAGAANKLESGAYLAGAFLALRGLTGSAPWALGLLVLLYAALVFAFWFFVKNVYTAAARRLFLEGRVYERVSLGRLGLFCRLGRWGRAAVTLFMRSLFLALWSLTVVGGFVKYCAYFPVPYLVAENPSLGWREALGLSKRMMAGRKGELFRFELTFLGWRVLSALTLGLSGILYSRPYRQAALSEYYCALRSAWLADHPESAAVLDDAPLFDAPTREALGGAYGDVLAAWEGLAPAPELPGLAGFLAGHFGLLLKDGPRERSYAQAVGRRARLEGQMEEAAGARYPTRLAPRKPKRPRRDLGAGRCYQVWTVVALFFAAAMLGWLWEVGYHFLFWGEFVNRGVLHGPWLPIYGFGACFILLGLYLWRDRPGRLFALAVAMCGVLEYGTGFYMELTSGGRRWWDYEGYLLNLHGRVCAEGLLAFGIGGCLVVYLLAPVLDDLLARAPRRAVVGVCLALLVLFAADELWSSVSPNQGPGVTDDLAAAPPPGYSLQIDTRGKPRCC